MDANEAYSPPVVHENDRLMISYRTVLIAIAVVITTVACIFSQSFITLALPLLFAVLLTRVARFGIITGILAIASGYGFFIFGAEMATESFPKFDEIQLLFYSRLLISVALGSSIFGILAVLISRQAMTAILEGFNHDGRIPWYI